MKKNKIIAIVAAVVIIVAGLVCWGIFQGKKIKDIAVVQSLEPVFGLSGTVSGVNVEDSFLMVKLSDSEKEVKVIITESAKLIRREEPENPPINTTFTPKETEVQLSDFKEGDIVFIKTKDNVAGKTKIDSVDFIHIQP